MEIRGTKKTGKLAFVKERHNPQLARPYYRFAGMLAVSTAKKAEAGTLYGAVNMIGFDTEAEAHKFIEEKGGVK
jgi:hypothetical protein